jgi:hypothetical protein
MEKKELDQGSFRLTVNNIKDRLKICPNSLVKPKHILG